MKYCDLTLAYTPTSGGIRTYIDAKRKYLKEHSDDEHVLIIPGSENERRQEGRITTCVVASPVIPGCAPYRFFWRPKRLLECLLEARPDVVELGSFFVCPYAAFRFRKLMQDMGEQCLVSAYFHTDVAKAYFRAPLEQIFSEEPGKPNEILGTIGHNIAESVEKRTEHHFANIFERCDMLMAATELQRERLFEYGVSHAEVVPLGVDLEMFHPDRRSEEFRSSHDADSETIIMIYAGRLDAEKNPKLLVDALSYLSLQKVKLILTGEGALRSGFEKDAETSENLIVVPYCQDRLTFATMLASSDIYVTAGPHETFGLSVVEAHASGLPVVGVDSGALPERVVEGTGFLGPPDDAKSMAKNIELVASDLVSMSTASRNHIVDCNPGWQGTCETLFGLYRNWFRNQSTTRSTK